MEQDAITETSAQTDDGMTEEEEAVVEDFDFDDLDLGGDDDLLDDDF